MGIDKRIDAFLETETEKLRIRACAIIIKDDSVLMIKNNTDDYLYSVGGAIKIGETIEEACLREAFEETGYPYEIDRLVFIHQSFFIMDANKWHEIAFYFLMKESDNTSFNTSNGCLGTVEHKVWIPISEYFKYKAYPAFFAEELLSLPTSIKLITSKEEGYI